MSNLVPRLLAVKSFLFDPCKKKACLKQPGEAAAAQFPQSIDVLLAFLKQHNTLRKLL